MKNVKIETKYGSVDFNAAHIQVNDVTEAMFVEENQHHWPSMPNEQRDALLKSTYEKLAGKNPPAEAKPTTDGNGSGNAKTVSGDKSGSGSSAGNSGKSATSN